MKVQKTVRNYMKENVQALNKCATAKVAMLLNWLLLICKYVKETKMKYNNKILINI